MKPTTNPCHHVYLAWVSTYLYDTFLYHPKGQGYHTSMTPGDLTLHRKYADHLKVTWYIVRLKKIWSTKIPRGKGGGEGLRLSAHGLCVIHRAYCLIKMPGEKCIKVSLEEDPSCHVGENCQIQLCLTILH